MAVSMLLKDTRFDPATREKLEIISRNAAMEARLIDDLLDVTRIERGKVELHRQPVDLRAVAQRAAEVCMPDIHEQEIKFSINAPGGPYTVDGDPARLQQVFWNLIKNSAKFTPSGGRISIRISRGGNNTAIAEVADTGKGIEPELMSRLFSAFEQGPPEAGRQQFGGLGLGLAISKGLVEMHGGTLTARSEGRNKGATFTLSLPLLTAATAAQPDAAAPLARQPAAPARALRILLVEDHENTAMMMSLLLTDMGHAVQVAGNTATALHLAGEGKPEKFDLIISDLGLPDGSGLDLMRDLAQKRLQNAGHRAQRLWLGPAHRTKS